MRLFDIPSIFRENITKDGLTSRVYAEVFFLKYFYLYKFQFLIREKYIRYSKPFYYYYSFYIKYNP